MHHTILSTISWYTVSSGVGIYGSLQLHTRPAPQHREFEFPDEMQECEWVGVASGYSCIQESPLRTPSHVKYPLCISTRSG